MLVGRSEKLAVSHQPTQIAPHASRKVGKASGFSPTNTNRTSRLSEVGNLGLEPASCWLVPTVQPKKEKYMTYKIMELTLGFSLLRCTIICGPYGDHWGQVSRSGKGPLDYFTTPAHLVAVRTKLPFHMKPFHTKPLHMKPIPLRRGERASLREQPLPLRRAHVLALWPPRPEGLLVGEPALLSNVGGSERFLRRLLRNCPGPKKKRTKGTIETCKIRKCAACKN